MSQQTTFDLESQDSGPVECLGQTFPSDEARREHYLELLTEKLTDPEFRKIEGFPIGEDEDILAMSDPPYYTACPNPWIGDFIEHYGRPYDSKEEYHREPFAADVSEGKNHPIYNAHSYHTKVPHRAVMRYILHYTEPGDVVFDGFCGTGMTGVAAQLCGCRKEVQELGYKVDSEGVVHDESGSPFSKLGARRVVLNDLAPVATFISSRYNDFQVSDYDKNPVLEEVFRKDGDIRKLYESAVDEGRFEFLVWSECFSCPSCQHESSLFDFAVDKDTYNLADEFDCENCGKTLSKSDLERVWSTSLAPGSDLVVRSPKSLPILVVAKGTGKASRGEPSDGEIESAVEVDHSLLDFVPNDEFPHGRQTRKVKSGSGISLVSQMFFPRSLVFASLAMSRALREMNSREGRASVFALSSSLVLISRRERFRGGSGKGAQSGTLYVPSLQVEKNPFTVLKRKIDSFRRMPMTTSALNGIINTGSHENLRFAPPESVDYIFTDPPFGESLQYAELNFFHEAWFRVFSAISKDCVLNYVHEKDLSFYQGIVRNAFAEAFRILKPGRWITVEFSNTGANLWNAIQTSLQEVGFVIANVAALDKVQRSFNSVITTTSVKQDLVISAYKPNGGLDKRFAATGHTVSGVWDFLKTHLGNLPVVKARGGDLEFIAERDPRILYDRMVAFYVGHGVPVPLSSAEFQAEVAEKFPERDDMVFLPDQVADYDKKRAQMQGVGQMSIFVEDEKSAIDWLRNFLKQRPSVSSDITPEFMQQLGASWKKFETRPELSLLLEQNFLQYQGDGEVPSQIHSYLSTQNKDLRKLPKDDARLKNRAKDRWYVPDPAKAVDVESLRNKRLLQEFWELCDEAGINRPTGDTNQPTLPNMPSPAKKKTGKKKLKEVRTEAVRLGFKECFAAKDYTTILALADHLPANVIEEDENLQMIYDMAEMRAEG